MSITRLVGVGLVLAAMAPNAAADANSLNDYLGPREISVGEVGRADARGSASTTLNPAGLALARQVVFEGSYGYRAIDGASSINVSACDSTVPIAGCFYYHFFNASPEVGGDTFDRSAHEFGTNLSRALSENIFIGLNMRYYDYNSDLMSEEDDSGFTADAGVIVRPTNMISIGFVGYNILPQDSPQYPTAVGGGVSLRPVPQLSIGADGLWDLDDDDDQGSGRYGVGSEYFLTAANKQSGYPLRVGYVYDKSQSSSYMTGGLGFLNAKIGLDVGVRKELNGGGELMVLAGLRFFGPTVR